jgi:hypothetical protein
MSLLEFLMKTSSMFTLFYVNNNINGKIRCQLCTELCGTERNAGMTFGNAVQRRIEGLKG